MRASSISSLMLLALTSGCSPDEPPVAVAPPEEAAPPDLPAPSQATLDELLRETEPVRSDAPSQSVINPIRERTQVVEQRQVAVAPSPFEPARTLDRLTFQCADEQTFAIRIRGNRIEVFPPGYTMGYLVLTEVPSDSGVRYTADDAEFRLQHDIATLRFGRDRYVDCVSNPAAAVWQQPPRRDLLPPR